MWFADKHIPLDQPRVMGILNVTPDSFSDGGQFHQLDAAVSRAEKMLAAGCDFIDIGGESTRPGAKDVSEQQELDRVIPVIEAIRARLDCVVSIDTSKAAVMRDAVAAGAGLINDVRALQEPGALYAAVDAGVPVCLMHMQGQPRTMQSNPQYGNVITEVSDFLRERAQICQQAGIEQQQILLDPGFGFGKSVQHNFRLLAHMDKLHQLGYPLLVGMSRKSMLGAVTSKPVEQRLAASISAATIAMLQGAQIIRVHDVEETSDALAIVQALNEQL